MTSNAIGRVLGEDNKTVTARIKEMGISPIPDTPGARERYRLRDYYKGAITLRPDMAAKERFEAARADKVEREVARLDGEFIPVRLLEMVLGNFASEVRREIEHGAGAKLPREVQLAVLHKLADLDTKKIVGMDAEDGE